MTDQSKWAFWGAAAAVCLIVSLPSVFFVDALSRYRAFFADVGVYSLRPGRVRFVPHRDGRRGIDPKAPLDFVDFSLKEPKAKTVALIGDFNGWNESALKLSQDGDGRWRIVVPLSKGRHGYLFVVDGAPKLDPANHEAAQIDGRKASVRTVR